ncbi:urea ABC transporter permease subunit UrtB, partial [Cribrihabitans sp. XS_ASV171]
EAAHLAALRRALPREQDPELAQRMARQERLLTIQYGESEAERIEAIGHFAGDLGVDVRAALNPLIATRLEVAEAVPDTPDLARVLEPGSEALPREAAYELLVDAGISAPPLSRDRKREVLVANIEGDMVGGVEVASLSTDAARDVAYAALVAQGVAEPAATEAEIEAALKAHVFFERFIGAPPAVAAAAAAVLSGIENSVMVNQAADLVLDAISLGSIYFLAAIGLAITFG